MAKLIPTATRYHRPASPDELAHLIGDAHPSSLILAGGTSLSFSRPAVERLVDVSGMPWHGCRRLPDGALEIGAVTTIGEFERNPDVAAFCGGFLRQATDRLASTPLRNLITVGGNVAAGFAWSDLPVACLALDARYRVFPGSGNDALLPFPVDGEQSLRQLSRSGRVISHIVLDGRFAAARGTYIKFARTASDLSLVSAAVVFRLENARMRDIRIVAGGLTAAPRRLPDVEAMLEGKEPDSGLFEKAGRAAEVMPRPDTRASEEYRLDVLKTLVTRACRQTAGDGTDEIR